MAVNTIQHATDEADWYEADGTLNATGVASLPLTLLTLDRARRELRVPPGDDGQDDLIREQIEAAVSFIQDDLNVPLLQESVYLVLQHDSLDQPITITNPSDPYVLAASKIRYQAASTAASYTVGDWPLEIEIGEENQIAPCSGDGDLIAGNVVISPPGGQWPEAAGNHYVVHYVRGIKASNKDVDLFRQLVILKLRDLFYGSPYMKGQESNTAYGRLKKTVRYLGLLPDFKRVS